MTCGFVGSGLSSLVWRNPYKFTGGFATRKQTSKLDCIMLSSCNVSFQVFPCKTTHFCKTTLLAVDKSSPSASVRGLSLFLALVLNIFVECWQDRREQIFTKDHE